MPLRSSAAREALLACALATACASSTNTTFPPDDARASEGDAAVDAGDVTVDAPRLDAGDAGDVGDVRPPLDAPCSADLRSDRLHCGACGHACAERERCAAGECVAVDCPATCRSDDDCASCSLPGETGIYCCASGLCLYTTKTCASTRVDVPDDEAVDPDPDIVFPIDVDVPFPDGPTEDEYPVDAEPFDAPPPDDAEPFDVPPPPDDAALPDDAAPPDDL